jgi:ergothioneine biosynthesis protein EgtB
VSAAVHRRDAPPRLGHSAAADALAARFLAIRARTEALAAPLSAEDQQLQSRPEASPVKWHRGHTTWFFETFVLSPRRVPPMHPEWSALFNSYYDALGPRHERRARGALSRPSAAEIAAWRRAVDERVVALLAALPTAELFAIAPLIELGVAHEEQHQELLLTDVLDAFALSPLRPAYHREAAAPAAAAAAPLAFVEHPGGVIELGAPPVGFAFDCERPRHRALLEPFGLASRLVTVGEVKAFIRDDGYRTPSLWLADGIDWVRGAGIAAPGNARLDGDDLVVFGLGGERVADDAEPAIHLSFYEADAIARWLGGRLPTEAEWEAVASRVEVAGNFLGGPLRPLPAGPGLSQLYGDAWEWTRSAFEPYPGFRPPAGAVGEYNGKFMSGQQVLRGGSFATPPGHLRPSYRNFWSPTTRFQFTGVRLARDLEVRR